MRNSFPLENGFATDCKLMTMKQPASANAFFKSRIYGLLIITVLLVCGAHAVRQFWNGDSGDFGYFYRAASAMSKGEDIYLATQGHYIYPPFLAFIFQPLTLLSERTAATIWTAINAALIFIAILIASRQAAARWPRLADEADVSLPWIIAAAVTCLMVDKIRGTLALGQTDCLMLLGFACVLRWMERRPMLAGLAVGASANVKYLTLICVPYFLVKRNYKAAFAAILAFLCFLLLPGIEVGYEKLVYYLASSVGGLTRLIATTPAAIHVFNVTWDRSISLTSSVFRLTQSAALPHAAAVILLLLLFSGIMAAIVSIGRSHGVSLFRRRQPKTETDPVTHIEWAVVVFFALAFSPQSTARHMVLVLLIYTVAMAIFIKETATISRILLGGALALVVAGLSLPFSTIGLAHQRTDWRAIGGPSWCVLILVLVIVWTGTHVIGGKAKNKMPDFLARP
jgi:hypothetical protein